MRQLPIERALFRYFSPLCGQRKRRSVAWLDRFPQAEAFASVDGLDQRIFVFELHRVETGKRRLLQPLGHSFA